MKKTVLPNGFFCGVYLMDYMKICIGVYVSIKNCAEIFGIKFCVLSS